MISPLVTISIPTRNSADFLARCLDSIRSQTYKNIEINIIDGGSSDITEEIAKKYKITDFVVYKGGLLGARFLGTKISNGEVVVLLDSDQILEPEAIQRAIDTMIVDNRLSKDAMLILGEDVYKTDTYIEKLFQMDRNLIHKTKDFSPFSGVMLPRIYSKKLLLSAFNAMPHDVIENVSGQDHAIIYYEAWQKSKNINLIQHAVKHIEPSDYGTIWKKFYRWGKTSVTARGSKYSDLLKKKERFRTGMFKPGTFKDSLGSLALLILKGVPYTVGVIAGRFAK